MPIFVKKKKKNYWKTAMAIGFRGLLSHCGAEPSRDLLSGFSEKKFGSLNPRRSM